MAIDRGRNPKIRHLVEVDSEPDELAFLLRFLSADAEKWRISRLGAVRSTQRVSALATGLHWTSLDVEIMANAAAQSGKLFHRQFLGAKSLRVLRISGTVEHELVDSYRPDVIFLGGASRLPAGYRAATVTWGEAIYEVAFASAGAEEAITALMQQLQSRLLAISISRKLMLSIGDLVLWDGFYQVESDGRGQWAWTGARRRSRFFVPALGRRPQLMSIYAYGAAVPIGQDSLAIFVNGERAPCRYSEKDLHIEVEVAEHSSCAHLVEVRHDRLVSTSDGSRDLGIALKAIKLEVM